MDLDWIGFDMTRDFSLNGFTNYFPLYKSAFLAIQSHLYQFLDISFPSTMGHDTVFGLSMQKCDVWSKPETVN